MTRYEKYGRKSSWIVEWCEKRWKKPNLNSDKIWKIQKKIVKWYGKYGRKASRTVIRYGQYGRKTSWTVEIYEKYGRNQSWIMKRFGKCRRKMCKDMENTDEK